MSTANPKQEIGSKQNLSNAGLEGDIYAPHPIAGRTFTFKETTLAAEEKASLDLVRLDESLRGHPYLSAIKKSLMRLEGMATVRSDGINPDLMLLLHLELAQDLGKRHPHEQKNYLMKKFPQCSSETIEASFEAFRCMDALDWIDQYQPKPNGFNVEDVWELYAVFMRGTRRERTSGIRKTNEQGSLKSCNSGILYIPPDAERLDELMEDFVAFCNMKSITSFTRSAVEHFQLEALKPVNEGLDRWGRMIALLIWKQSDVLENIIPPFSLTPALLTKTHTELLIPYQTGQNFTKGSAMNALDTWVAHCAQATELGVRQASIYREGIEKLQKLWRDRLGNVTQGSPLDALLIELAGMPLITVSRAAEITEKRFQGASETIEKLVEAQILEPLTEVKRNRIFIA